MNTILLLQMMPNTPPCVSSMPSRQLVLDDSAIPAKCTNCLKERVHGIKQAICDVVGFGSVPADASTMEACILEARSLNYYEKLKLWLTMSCTTDGANSRWTQRNLEQAEELLRTLSTPRDSEARRKFNSMALMLQRVHAICPDRGVATWHPLNGCKDSVLGKLEGASSVLRQLKTERLVVITKTHFTASKLRWSGLEAATGLSSTSLPASCTSTWSSPSISSLASSDLDVGVSSVSLVTETTFSDDEGIQIDALVEVPSLDLGLPAIAVDPVLETSYSSDYELDEVTPCLPQEATGMDHYPVTPVAVVPVVDHHLLGCTLEHQLSVDSADNNCTVAALAATAMEGALVPCPPTPEPHTHIPTAHSWSGEVVQRIKQGVCGDASSSELPASGARITQQQLNRNRSRAPAVSFDEAAAVVVVGRFACELIEAAVEASADATGYSDVARQARLPVSEAKQHWYNLSNMLHYGNATSLSKPALHRDAFEAGCMVCSRLTPCLKALCETSGPHKQVMIPGCLDWHACLSGSNGVLFAQAVGACVRTRMCFEMVLYGGRSRPADTWGVSVSTLIKQHDGFGRFFQEVGIKLWKTTSDMIHCIRSTALLPDLPADELRRSLQEAQGVQHWMLKNMQHLMKGAVVAEGRDQGAMVMTPIPGAVLDAVGSMVLEVLYRARDLVPWAVLLHHLQADKAALAAVDFSAEELLAVVVDELQRWELVGSMHDGLQQVFWRLSA